MDDERTTNKISTEPGPEPEPTELGMKEKTKRKFSVLEEGNDFLRDEHTETVDKDRLDLDGEDEEGGLEFNLITV